MKFVKESLDGKMSSKNEQKKFIIDYLRKNKYVDVCTQDFHDKFYEMFGGKRTIKNFGACPVHKAQRLLEDMYKSHDLGRYTVGLSGHEWGFPKWVYMYYLLE